MFLSVYLQLKPIRPRIDNLYHILQLSMFYGQTAETSSRTQELVHSNFYTKETLQQDVQASSKELSTALSGLGVVELNGFLRMLAPAAVLEAKKAIFDTIIEHDLPLDAVDEQSLRGKMQNIDVVILRHVLHTIGHTIADNSTIWSLDRNKILRANAHILFQSNKTLSEVCANFCIIPLN
jgi:hypothetical protein